MTEAAEAASCPERRRDGKPCRGRPAQDDSDGRCPWHRDRARALAYAERLVSMVGERARFADLLAEQFDPRSVDRALAEATDPAAMDRALADPAAVFDLAAARRRRETDG